MRFAWLRTSHPTALSDARGRVRLRVGFGGSHPGRHGTYFIRGEEYVSFCRAYEAVVHAHARDVICEPCDDDDYAAAATTPSD